MGDTNFDINAFKAHSKQKDIKQSDTLYLDAFVAHSKQWAGFFERSFLVWVIFDVRF